MKVLTAERLREVLIYDAASGVFMDRATGAVVGYETHGYLRIVVDGKRYYAHRLAVLYVKGRWPIRLADHRNLNGLDNRWENIREADKSLNGANSSVKVTNRLGIKGVSLCKLTGKYRADITVNGKHINLGRRETIAEAAALYEKAAKQHFGEFARC